MVNFNGEPEAAEVPKTGASLVSLGAGDEPGAEPASANCRVLGSIVHFNGEPEAIELHPEYTP